MKKRFNWTGEARTDLRRIRKEQVLDILKALDRFSREGAGDIRKLTDDAQALTDSVQAIIGYSFDLRRTMPSTF